VPREGSKVEPRWVALSYHNTLESAVAALVGHAIKASDAAEAQALVDEIAETRDDMRAAPAENRRPDGNRALCERLPVSPGATQAASRPCCKSAVFCCKPKRRRLLVGGAKPLRP
jgi:hypothetical protein